MPLAIHPITAARFEDVEALFATDSVMRSCWDIWPRYAGGDRSEIDRRFPRRSQSQANRLELRRLAARRRAPGLLAYDGREAIGFVSLGPRTEMKRTDASRATPRVDDVPVWVIPCMFVRKDRRGEGVTVALLRGAVEYAARHGAPAVEGYPRASRARMHDSTAFFGNVTQFRRAGFRKVAGPLAGLPRNWVPRITMRTTIAPPQPAARRRRTG